MRAVAVKATVFPTSSDTLEDTEDETDRETDAGTAFVITRVELLLPQAAKKKQPRSMTIRDVPGTNLPMNPSVLE